MKIFAIGYNYAAYNKENEEPLYNKEYPVVFTKADSALLKDKKPMFLPDDLGAVECEAALVVRISRLGKSIPERFAHRYYDAVTCGADFTATGLMARLRSEGLPWDMAKSFDGAAAIGSWMPLEECGPVDDIHFRLDINGQTAHSGHTADMLRTVDRLVATISRSFTLRTGDIIFTGAPMPGREVSVNDHIDGYINGKKVLEFNVK